MLCSHEEDYNLVTLTSPCCCNCAPPLPSLGLHLKSLPSAASTTIPEARNNVLIPNLRHVKGEENNALSSLPRTWSRPIDAPGKRLHSKLNFSVSNSCYIHVYVTPSNVTPPVHFITYFPSAQCPSCITARLAWSVHGLGNAQRLPIWIRVFSTVVVQT